MINEILGLDNEELIICCETIEQTRIVINKLLELGCKHGSSGVSEKILGGSNDTNHWIHPFVTNYNRIEFYNNGYGFAELHKRSHNAVKFDDFIAFVEAENNDIENCIDDALMNSFLGF